MYVWNVIHAVCRARLLIWARQLWPLFWVKLGPNHCIRVKQSRVEAKLKNKIQRAQAMPSSEIIIAYLGIRNLLVSLGRGCESFWTPTVVIRNTNIQWPWPMHLGVCVFVCVRALLRACEDRLVLTDIKCKIYITHSRNMEIVKWMEASPPKTSSER